MLDKILKDIITIVVGKQYEEIANLLNSKEHINEFLIAKKLNLTINQTRNVLYKISNEGLVSSVRKKDKRKGWYTYYWKLDILKSLEYMKDILKKRINELNQEAKEKEKKVYYHCNRCNLEVEEESALSTNFSCNECGDIYSIKDNSNPIKEIKKEILKLEEKMDLIDKEIIDEKGVLEKKKTRTINKIEKEKQLLKKVKREKMKSAKDALKKIELKKLKKVVVKKQSKLVKKQIKKPVKKFIKKVKSKKR